ncbi:hypothetical protein HU200_051653 [Digitaria exilis]|uniref:Uncharacterized protein n=1 Tax=Digitaria exilis TaxID=1010633 RepID=A0A835EA97_9POAL|nr:hypothetical protein HU200_051653 [Digitaria exilis]
MDLCFGWVSHYTPGWPATVCIDNDLDGASWRNPPCGTGWSSAGGLACQKSSHDTQFEAACRASVPATSRSCLSSVSTGLLLPAATLRGLPVLWPFHLV